MVLAAFCVTLASGTVTTFKTGPFTGSVDLGVPCNDINISKPVQRELLSGNSYTDYLLTVCGDVIEFVRYDASITNPNEDFGADIKSDLLEVGADKDTISVFKQKIDGNPGAVGSGYIPKHDKKLCEATFWVSSRTIGHIGVWRNETMMISALKIIHLTETA